MLGFAPRQQLQKVNSVQALVDFVVTYQQQQLDPLQASSQAPQLGSGPPLSSWDFYFF